MTPKIFIIEDDCTIRTELETLLTGNGFSLCSNIRSFSDVPIIFVTSCSTDMDKLSSIMLGGDAFITKPYNTAILLAKIASSLKKAYPKMGQETLTYQGVTLHLDSSKIEYNGHIAELTKNEAKILFYLFKHAGSICVRADLIEYLWDNQLYVDDNALSVNVNRIRDKLSSIGLTDFIKTRHRHPSFHSVRLVSDSDCLSLSDLRCPERTA